MADRPVRQVGHRVWIYGSLMSMPSLLDTLGGRSSAPEAEVTRIVGWRRRWNCVSTKTFLTGHPPDRVRRVVLGLEPGDDAVTTGLVIGIDETEMAQLRRREVAYDEVDITDAIASSSAPTVTFVPKATRRRGQVETAETLVVERDYLDRCVTGAEDFGLDHVADELRTTLDLEVVEAAGDVEHRPVGR